MTPDSAADLVVKSLETEPVKNLLNPVTEQLGLMAGDVAGLVRFYVNDNLTKVFTKWARQREYKALPAGTDFASVIPILYSAQFQSNDELQELFAALLESSVSTPADVLPSFATTLAQLTPEEARYMIVLFEERSTRHRSDVGELGNLKRLYALYDSDLKNITFETRHVLEERIAKAELVIHDLLRLGILMEKQRTKKNLVLPTFGTRERVAEELLSHIQALGIETTFSFSEYGKKLIKAVSPTKAEPKPANPL